MKYLLKDWNEKLKSFWRRNKVEPEKDDATAYVNDDHIYTLYAIQVVRPDRHYSIKKLQ